MNYYHLARIMQLVAKPDWLLEARSRFEEPRILAFEKYERNHKKPSGIFRIPANGVSFKWVGTPRKNKKRSLEKETLVQTNHFEVPNCCFCRECYVWKDPTLRNPILSAIFAPPFGWSKGQSQRLIFKYYCKVYQVNFKFLSLTQMLRLFGMCTYTRFSSISAERLVPIQHRQYACHVYDIPGWVVSLMCCMICFFRNVQQLLLNKSNMSSWFYTWLEITLMSNEQLVIQFIH